MHELHLLQQSPGVPRLSNARSGVYSVWGKVDPNDWHVADSIARLQGPAVGGFERLVRVWTRPGAVARTGPAKGASAHAGWDYGIRAPERGETAPCWEEVLSFLRIGAHEVDA